MKLSRACFQLLALLDIVAKAKLSVQNAEGSLGVQRYGHGSSWLIMARHDSSKTAVSADISIGLLTRLELTAMYSGIRSYY